MPPPTYAESMLVLTGSMNGYISKRAWLVLLLFLVVQRWSRQPRQRVVFAGFVVGRLSARPSCWAGPADDCLVSYGEARPSSSSFHSVGHSTAQPIKVSEDRAPPGRADQNLQYLRPGPSRFVNLCPGPADHIGSEAH